MEFHYLDKLLPILGSLFIFLGVFGIGKLMRGVSDQSTYFELHGKKLKYRSAEFNGTNYGLCMEFLVSDHHLGFRCYFPAYNYVAKYSDITVSQTKEFIGYRVRFEIPSIGVIKINRRLAYKLNRLSKGKLSSDIT